MNYRGKGSTCSRAEWMYIRYRSLFVRWSLLLSSYMTMHLYKSLSEDKSAAIALRLLLMTTTCYTTLVALIRGRYALARAAIFSFVLLELLTYNAIGLGFLEPSRSYEESIAARWADFIMLLAFYSPALVIIDLPFPASVCLVMASVAVMAPYYVQTTGCSALSASIRALVGCISSFLLYWKITCKLTAIYESSGYDDKGLEARNSTSELDNNASCSEPVAFSMTRLCGDSKPLQYLSPFRRSKVYIQFGIHVGPCNIPSIAVLLERLATRLPNSAAVEAAVRLGCVIVSLEVVDARDLGVRSMLVRGATDLCKQVKSAAAEWASQVIHGMEPEALAMQQPPILSVQVGDQKEVLVLDERWQAWSSAPDPAPLPPRGALRMHMPHLARTWPAPGSPSQGSSCGKSWLAPVREVAMEVWLEAMDAAALEAVHAWRGCPAVDEPAMAARAPVLLVRTRGRYLPVQLQPLGRVEHAQGSTFPQARASSTSHDCEAAQRLRRRFQVSVSIPADLLDVDAGCAWCLLHLELCVQENLLASCPFMLVPPRHADVAADLASMDVSEGAGDFLRDLADWVFLQRHGRLPLMVAVQQQQQQQQQQHCQQQHCQQLHPQGGLEEAALMATLSHDLLAQAQLWGMSALARLLRMGADPKPPGAGAQQLAHQAQEEAPLQARCAAAAPYPGVQVAAAETERAACGAAGCAATRTAFHRQPKDRGLPSLITQLWRAAVVCLPNVPASLGTSPLVAIAVLALACACALHSTATQGWPASSG